MEKDSMKEKRSIAQSTVRKAFENMCMKDWTFEEELYDLVVENKACYRATLAHRLHICQSEMDCLIGIYAARLIELNSPISIYDLISEEDFYKFALFNARVKIYQEKLNEHDAIENENFLILKYR